MGLEALVGPDRDLILGGIEPSLTDYPDGVAMGLADAVWGYHHRLLSGAELVGVTVYHLAAGEELPSWAFEVASLLRNELWKLPDLVPALNDPDSGISPLVSSRWRYRLVRLLFDKRDLLGRAEHNLHVLIDVLDYPMDMNGIGYFRTPDGRPLAAVWLEWLRREESRIGFDSGTLPTTSTKS